MSADHIVPVSRGGDEAGPLTVLCSHCNSRKRDSVPGAAGARTARRPAVRAAQPRTGPVAPSRKPDTVPEVYDVPSKPTSRTLSAAPEPDDEPLAPPPPPPDGAGARGLRLWTDITDDFDLAAHELVGLEEMVRIADTLDELHRIVQVEGLMVPVLPHGTKVNPAAVEARQLRIVFARIAAALRLPSGDEDGEDAVKRPQRRGGARGVYGIRGVVG
jgi:hypothetical protein